MDTHHITLRHRHRGRPYHAESQYTEPKTDLCRSVASFFYHMVLIPQIHGDDFSRALLKWYRWLNSTFRLPPHSAAPLLLLTAASLQPLPCAGVGASCPVIAHSISHLSNSHPVVGVISGDYTFADNRAAECLHRRVQKCGGHEGTGAVYCTKSRAAPEIRTVLSASSAPIRDPTAKWVCAWMPSIPVCSGRPRSSL